MQTQEQQFLNLLEAKLALFKPVKRERCILSRDIHAQCIEALKLGVCPSFCHLYLV